LSLGNTIRTVITAGLIKETISATLEMAKLAGQVDGVKRAFDKLPGATLLMADLKEKTHGTLDDLTLMQKAVQAQNFKIPLEQLGTLLEFAAVKAQQTGLDINYLTDSIITGLGRGSLKILDNLQFSMTDLKAKTKELGSTQAAVFFLVNEQMQKMGGYVENDGTKVKQLEADFKNLGQTVATIASKSGGLGMLTSIMDDIVKGANLFVRAWTSGGSESIVKFHEITKALVEQDQITKQATDATLKFTKAHQGDTEAIDTEIKRLDALNSARRIAIIDAQFQGKTGEPGQMEAEERGISVRKQQIDLLKKYRDEVELSKKPNEDQKGLIEAIDERIKQLNEDLIKATSRKRIIEIQVQIQQAETDKADLLDPDRMARAAKESYDKTNAAIAQGIREQAQTILKESSKNAKAISEGSLYKQTEKDVEKDFKGFLKGRQMEQKELEDQEEAHQKRMQRLMHFAGQQIYMNARQIANELIQNEVNQYDQRIQALQDYYSNQETLAGTNSKRVAQLQKEEALKQKQLEKEKTAAQKRATIQRIEIDTAANVVKSILENGGIPWGLPFGGIAAALGLLQIGLVNRYAKGIIDLKGPGTETSDSIPSLLSRGESVMTAEETRNSGNILRNIRSKKLNDQVLEKLTVTADGIIFKPDNSDVVQAINSNKQPDIVRQFSTIYEAKEVGKNMKRIIRSKSFTN